ncbi:interferon-related developmental regulator-domain-containing protein [Protomyces lactucae-debilis]|uniref:Interferon-related developmental regulator-domain-containing protein n=1 Tax=Protomyces lactucae-debilis TaxID=2754530 RepID=A0A1Y2FS14_PROLT|nr:interferon-related developmental regulator-domain-containing protein [Protomyces lactucae-debilis]ORY86800.1 interferon-related developmental regulator-domain-containing protein [Protomyces lactucae-debilis]
MDLRRSLVEKRLSARSKPSSKQGSKQNSRAGSAYGTDDELDDDDGLSVASFESVDSLMDGHGAAAGIQSLTYEEDLAQTIEGVLERKGSGVGEREQLLTRLVKLLLSRVATKEIVEKASSLAGALSKILKSARSEREALLACKAIAILYWTCPDIDDIFATCAPVLRYTIQSSSFIIAKAAALTALASIHLIFGSISDVESFLDMLVEIIENDGHSIGAGEDAGCVAAAQDAVALALTAMEGSDTALESAQICLPCLVDQLESVDLKVRTSAGEAIALAFEITGVHDPEDEEAIAEYKANPPIDDTHFLIRQLSQLSTESSKRVSKQHRKEQHAAFREILATVSNPHGLVSSGSTPQETLRFGKHRGQVLYVTTWLGAVRLAHLRRVLGGGLQVFLRQSSFVRRQAGFEGHLASETVGGDGEDEHEADEEHGGSGPSHGLTDDMSKDLKNSIHQEIRRQRHKDRITERKEKNMANSFSADDGEL